MILKNEKQLAAHIETFPGLTPERRAEIVDHLTHLPEGHISAVRAVLERDDKDPEHDFVRGCFVDETKPAAAPTPAAATEPGHEDLQPAA